MVELWKKEKYRIGGWKKNYCIKILEWAPQSPDLNPIENIWAFVKDKLSRRVSELTTKDKLIEAIEDIWWEDPEIPKEYLKLLPRYVSKDESLSV